MPSESSTTPIRPAATFAWGSMTIINAAITTPFIVSATYCTIAKISPPLTPLRPFSMRQPPIHTISTAAIFISAMVSGETSPMLTFAWMMLSAMTCVASSMRLCSRGSLLKARITRMPCRRSRTMSFCLST